MGKSVCSFFPVPTLVLASNAEPERQATGLAIVGTEKTASFRQL